MDDIYGASSWSHANPTHSAYLGDVLLRFFADLKGENVDTRAYPSDLINYKLVDLAEWLFVPTNKQVVLLQEIARDGTGLVSEYLPLFEKIDAIETNILYLPSSPSPQEQHIWETGFLFEMTNEIQSLAGEPGFPEDCSLPLDAFTRGIFDLLNPLRRDRSKKGQANIPLWLTFATRIFVDIHVILGGLGGCSTRGLQEMQLSGKRANDCVRKHEAFQVGKYSSSWPPEYDQSVTNLGQLVRRWSLADRLAFIRKQVKGDPRPPYYLMMAHSLWCGVMTFHFRLTLFQLGTFLANCWNSVMPMMHLYNAARHVAGISAWKDLEFLITQHDEKYLFVGGRPTKPEQFMPKVLLAMGQSMREFAPGGATRGGPTMKGSGIAKTGRGMEQGARYLRQNVVLVKKFAYRYHAIGANIEQTQEPDMMAVLLEFAKKTRDAVAISTDQKYPNSVQLLASLRAGVTIEDEHLQFDYFSLHQTCIEFLPSLRQGLWSELRDLNRYTEDDMLSDASLDTLPLIILQYEEINAKGSRGNNKMLLQKASRPLQVMIDKHGSKELDRVAAFQSTLKNGVLQNGTGETESALVLAPSAAISQMDSDDTEEMTEGVEWHNGMPFIMRGTPASRAMDRGDNLSLGSDPASSRREDRQLLGSVAQLLEKNQDQVPTMAASKENGLREIQELMRSMGRTENVEEMLRTDPMRLLGIIAGTEGFQGPSAAAATPQAEKKKKNNANKNKNRKLKKKAAGGEGAGEE